ncbi:MAG: alpha/beta hydrolase [Janthinobacterium lividum]
MPLNPTIATMLAQLAAAGRPALSAGTPEQARQMMSGMREAYGAGPAVRRVEALTIPTRAGAIPARLLADAEQPAGLIVYLHGGGWVLGGLDDFDAFGRVLAQRSGCAVLMVDYRLAPEDRFPAAIEDCIDATLWAQDQCAALLGAAVPLLVGGDSAGGNLAALVAAALRGRVALALQLLIYPVTDAAFDTPSYQAYGEGLPLTRQDMVWFFGHYAPGVDRADPTLHPAALQDLAGLPPAHVVTAEYDVLRDEGEAYAARLSQAGVPTTLRRYDGLTHGFIRLLNLVREVDGAVSDMATACAQACNRTGAKA